MVVVLVANPGAVVLVVTPVVAAAVLRHKLVAAVVLAATQVVAAAVLRHKVVAAVVPVVTPVAALPMWKRKTPGAMMMKKQSMTAVEPAAGTVASPAAERASGQVACAAVIAAALVPIVVDGARAAAVAVADAAVLAGAFR